MPRVLPFDLGLRLRMLRAARARRRRDRKAGKPAPASGSAIAVAYRALAAGRMDRMARSVLRMRTRSQSPRAWLDLVFATWILHRSNERDDGAAAVVRFADAYYDPADLARGLERCARRLRRISRRGRTLIEPARTALEATSWESIRLATPAVSPASYPVGTPSAPKAKGSRKEPVVLRMTGGLGNQLFQFAAAWAYAQRVGAKVLLDLEAYERPGALRDLLLPRLRVETRGASLSEVARAARHPHRQPTTGLDAALLLGEPGLEALQGYWEHPAYFEAFDAEVKEAFRPRDVALEKRARDLVVAVRKPHEDVAALHVRRGDRVQGKPGAAPHRELPLEYFRRAVALFPPTTRFLVFSDSPDDLDWCRDHLDLDPGKLSYAQGLDPIFDLVAMSACDHVIMAGSTFSWWAAWLGNRPGRRVVGPLPLVAHGPVAMDHCRPSRMPPEWTLVAFPPPDHGRIRQRAEPRPFA